MSIPRDKRRRKR